MNTKKFANAKWAALLTLLTAAVLALAMLAGCQQQEAQKTDENFAETAADALPSIDEPFYMLLVGNDSRTGTVEEGQGDYANGLGRSDTTMLCRIDPVTYTVTLITIPRDTAIELNGETTKFNYAYQGEGMDGAIEQAELLTGADIYYYFDVGFEDFQNLVDALGGLTINVPVDMEMQDIVGGETVTLSAGEQNLNGVQALVAARERHTFGDNQEAKRQVQDRALVVAGIQKVAQDSSLVETAVSAMMQCADTNMTQDQLTKLVTNFAQNADKLTIYQATGPYAGDTDPESGLWITMRDEATWQQIIQAADAGEDPSGIVPIPSV